MFVNVSRTFPGKIDLKGDFSGSLNKFATTLLLYADSKYHFSSQSLSNFGKKHAKIYINEHLASLKQLFRKYHSESLYQMYIFFFSRFYSLSKVNVPLEFKIKGNAKLKVEIKQHIPDICFEKNNLLGHIILRYGGKDITSTEIKFEDELPKGYSKSLEKNNDPKYLEQMLYEVLVKIDQDKLEYAFVECVSDPCLFLCIMKAVGYFSLRSMILNEYDLLHKFKIQDNLRNIQIYYNGKVDPNINEYTRFNAVEDVPFLIGYMVHLTKYYECKKFQELESLISDLDGFQEEGFLLPDYKKVNTRKDVLQTQGNNGLNSVKDVQESDRKENQFVQDTTFNNISDVHCNTSSLQRAEYTAPPLPSEIIVSTTTSLNNDTVERPSYLSFDTELSCNNNTDVQTHYENIDNQMQTLDMFPHEHYVRNNKSGLSKNYSPNEESNSFQSKIENISAKTPFSFPQVNDWSLLQPETDSVSAKNLISFRHGNELAPSTRCQIMETGQECFDKYQDTPHLSMQQESSSLVHKLFKNHNANFPEHLPSSNMQNRESKNNISLCGNDTIINPLLHLKQNPQQQQLESSTKSVCHEVVNSLIPSTPLMPFNTPMAAALSLTPVITTISTASITLPCFNETNQSNTPIYTPISTSARNSEPINTTLSLTSTVFNEFSTAMPLTSCNTHENTPIISSTRHSSSVILPAGKITSFFSVPPLTRMTSTLPLSTAPLSKNINNETITEFSLSTTENTDFLPKSIPTTATQNSNAFDFLLNNIAPTGTSLVSSKTSSLSIFTTTPTSYNTTSIQNTRVSNSFPNTTLISIGFPTVSKTPNRFTIAQSNVTSSDRLRASRRFKLTPFHRFTDPSLDRTHSTKISKSSNSTNTQTNIKTPATLIRSNPNFSNTARSNLITSPKISQSGTDELRRSCISDNTNPFRRPCRLELQNKKDKDRRDEMKLPDGRREKENDNKPSMFELYDDTKEASSGTSQMPTHNCLSGDECLKSFQQQKDVLIHLINQLNQTVKTAEQEYLRLTKNLVKEEKYLKDNNDVFLQEHLKFLRDKYLNEVESVKANLTLNNEEEKHIRKQQHELLKAQEQWSHDLHKTQLSNDQNERDKKFNYWLKSMERAYVEDREERKRSYDINATRENHIHAMKVNDILFEQKKTTDFYKNLWAEQQQSLQLNLKREDMLLSDRFKYENLNLERQKYLDQLRFADREYHLKEKELNIKLSQQISRFNQYVFVPDNYTYKGSNEYQLQECVNEPLDIKYKNIFEAFMKNWNYTYNPETFIYLSRDVWLTKTINDLIKQAYKVIKNPEEFKLMLQTGVPTFERRLYYCELFNKMGMFIFKTGPFFIYAHFVIPLIHVQTLKRLKKQTIPNCEMHKYRYGLYLHDNEFVLKDQLEFVSKSTHYPCNANYKVIDPVIPECNFSRTVEIYWQDNTVNAQILQIPFDLLQEIIKSCHIKYV